MTGGYAVRTFAAEKVGPADIVLWLSSFLTQVTQQLHMQNGKQESRWELARSDVRDNSGMLKRIWMQEKLAVGICHQVGEVLVERIATINEGHYTGSMLDSSLIAAW